MAWSEMDADEINSLMAFIRGEEVIDVDAEEEDDAPLSEDDENLAMLPLLVRRANARFDRELLAAARDLGYEQVGPSGLHVLRVISPQGTPVVTLADRLCVSRQATSKVVMRLEDHGLVQRQERMRNVVVKRTAEGRRVLRNVNEAIVDVVWGWGLFADPTRIGELARDLRLLATDNLRRPG